MSDITSTALIDRLTTSFLTCHGVEGIGKLERLLDEIGEGHPIIGPVISLVNLPPGLRSDVVEAINISHQVHIAATRLIEMKSAGLSVGTLVSVRGDKSVIGIVQCISPSTNTFTVVTVPSNKVVSFVFDLSALSVKCISNVYS